MDIKLRTKLDPIPGDITDPIRAEKPSPGADYAWFGQSAQLDQALAATPEVRPEAVRRGQELVAIETYPPPETIRKISELLAIEIRASWF